jgi:hypothetical protein
MHLPLCAASMFMTNPCLFYASTFYKNEWKFVAIFYIRSEPAILSCFPKWIFFYFKNVTRRTLLFVVLFQLSGARQANVIPKKLPLPGKRELEFYSGSRCISIWCIFTKNKFTNVRFSPLGYFPDRESPICDNGMQKNLCRCRTCRSLADLGDQRTNPTAHRQASDRLIDLSFLQMI